MCVAIVTLEIIIKRANRVNGRQQLLAKFGWNPIFNDSCRHIFYKRIICFYQAAHKSSNCHNDGLVVHICTLYIYVYGRYTYISLNMRINSYVWQFPFPSLSPRLIIILCAFCFNMDNFVVVCLGLAFVIILFITEIVSSAFGVVVQFLSRIRQWDINPKIKNPDSVIC